MLQPPLSAALLTWHIHHFHPVGYDAHEGFSWHIHLIFPWEDLDEPTLPETPRAPRPSSAYSMPYVLSQAPTIVDVGSAADSASFSFDLLRQDRIDAPHLEETCVPGLHFLQTYSPNVPLRALICVARC
jgi:hypothetical protein